jgi:hypothetical protein
MISIQNIKNNNFFGWACDYQKNSGEGKLARLFLQNKLRQSKENILLLTNSGKFIIGNSENRITKKQINYNSFYHKYTSPFIGCYYSWFFFFKREKFIYLNYIPLWNVFLFLFLAPRTILGPITGSHVFSSGYLRKYFIPILYRISCLILKFRFKKIVFATENLKKFTSLSLRKKSKFNYCLNYIKKNKKFSSSKNQTKKVFDIVIYFRNHNNKNNIFVADVARFFVNTGYKVISFGDRLNIVGVTNYGAIDSKIALKLISKSRVAINSGENFYTFFLMDCINSKTCIVSDKQSAPKRFFKSEFISLLNFKKRIHSFSAIRKIISTY